MVTTMLRGGNPGIAVLRNVIPSALSAEVQGDRVKLSTGSPPIDLRPQWVGEGYPADVVRGLAAAGGEAPTRSTVVTARQFSPGAIRMLTDLGLSWADAQGNASISVPPGLFISTVRPRALARRATATMTWSPSMDAVAEYVLCRAAQAPSRLTPVWNGVDRVARIADVTGVSRGQVAKVLVAFDAAGYTEKFGPERGPTATRELRDRGRLLSDWAAHRAKVPETGNRAELHLLSRAPEDWTSLARQRLTELPWAVSGWVGAHMVAPFATAIPDMVLYVQQDTFDEALARLGDDERVSKVERGGRIHLRSAAPHVFSFTSGVESVKVVSPVRVYADMLRVGGRAFDAADHLRDVAIGF